MKQRIITVLALITVALVLSLVVIRRDTLTNVNPCATTPGCVSSNNEIAGSFTTTTYGFPVAYRTSETFRPTTKTSYKEMTIAQEGVHVAAIVIDVLFWFALLHLLWYIRTSVIHQAHRRFDEQAAQDITPAEEQTSKPSKAKK